MSVVPPFLRPGRTRVREALAGLRDAPPLQRCGRGGHVGLNANGPATAGALAAVVVGADEALAPPVPDPPELAPPDPLGLAVAGAAGELVPLD
jgi:hypothetical protein